MNQALLIFMLFFALPINAMQNPLEAALYHLAFHQPGTELNQQLSSAATQENPDKEQIRSLIAAKADINYISNDRSILHWAASLGHEKACMILLEAGANPNTNAQSGWNNGWHTTNPTPLMAAIDHKFIEASCLMIEEGADIHIKNSYDRNALWMACEKNLPEVCKLLIEKQADINIQDKVDQLTPLMIGILRWNTPLCKLFLKNGADLHIRSKHAETVLIMAARMNAQDLTLAMLNHVLFPSKTESKFFMYSLARLRTTNPIANFLYKEAKSLLAPWLLHDIASKNKQACIDLLEMQNIHSNRAFEHFPVSLLNPECINKTIESLIQNQLGNIEL